MSGPLESKAEIRRRLRAAFQALTPADRQDASLRLCHHLLALPQWASAGSILAFVPTRTEPDIWPAIVTALAEGQRILLPRFEPAAGVYETRELRDPATDLHPGPYGIPEPRPNAPKGDVKQLDFILVPGVAFTALGGRLGRGKGYYDRLLADAMGIKCGVAFDWQLMPEFPLEPHDVRLDLMVTPTRSWNTAAGCP